MPYVDMAQTFKLDPAGKVDALAMVVNSIAFEEANLAELMDTQSKEIACLSKMINGDIHGIGRAIYINQSINSILEKVIRLLIHQQLELEAIYRIFSSEPPSVVTQDVSAIIPDIGKTVKSPDIPAEPDISAAPVDSAPKTLSDNNAISENNSTFDNSKTEASLPDAEPVRISASGFGASSNVKHAEKFENMPEAMGGIVKTICALKGRGVGTVRNRSDYFYEGISIIQAYMCLKSQSGIDNYLCYSVHNSTSMQILIAFPDCLKMVCRLSDYAKKVEIKGEGEIIRKERCKPDVFDKGAFELNVVFDGNAAEKCCFYMTIKSKGNANFDHCSGKIELDSGLLEMEDRFI